MNILIDDFSYSIKSSSQTLRERERERGGGYTCDGSSPSLGGYEYRCFPRDKMTYVLSESTLHIYVPYLDEKYNKDVLSVNIKGSYTTCF